MIVHRPTAAARLGAGMVGTMRRFISKYRGFIPDGLSKLLRPVIWDLLMTYRRKNSFRVGHQPDGSFRSRVIGAILLGCFAAASHLPAVIISGSLSGSGPSASDYVGTVGGASGIYLGSYGDSYWVLTANHVRGGDFTVDGTTYSYVAGSGKQVGTLDLYVFQITVTGGSALAGLSNLTLGSTTPSSGTSVVMVGNGGGDRDDSETHWRTSTVSGTTTWTEVTSRPYSYSGYLYDTSERTASWGTNTISSVTSSGGTEYLVTQFDDLEGDAQAVVGDSGGGMFYWDSSTGSYTLAGVLDEVTKYTGQPDDAVVYGTSTYSIDVASYRDQILAAIPEPGTASLLAGLASVVWVLNSGRSWRRKA